MAEFKAYNKLVKGVDLDTTQKNLTYAADGERYEREYLELKAALEAEGFFDSEEDVVEFIK